MISDRILHALLFTPGPGGHWGLPALFWGPPGVAKSAVLRDIAKRSGLALERLSPAERGEGEFGVTPVPRTDANGRVLLDHPPAAWVDALERAGRGVVFLDEINRAEPRIQAPLLGLVLDRVIGDRRLPGGVRTFAAANPEDSASGVQDLDAALANRFLHLAWSSPSADQWTAWALGTLGGDREEVTTGQPAEVEEARVAALWPGAYAKALGLVAGFLNVRGGLLHVEPPAESPERSRAWPSPRTWEYAARVRATAEVHGLTEVELGLLVDGCIGTGAAAEWAAWTTDADLPDPGELLDGKRKWSPDPARLDRIMAVLGSCAGTVISDTDKKRQIARGVRLWELLYEVTDHALDVAVPAASALVRANLGRRIKELRAGAERCMARLSPIEAYLRDDA